MPNEKSPEVVKHVAEYGEWFYLTRGISYPSDAKIACDCPEASDHFVPAADVFEAARLDLNELKKIFNGRREFPDGGSYHDLGSCQAEDTKNWKRLAALSGRKVVVHVRHGDPDEDREDAGSYYPDGRMEYEAQNLPRYSGLHLLAVPLDGTATP